MKRTGYVVASLLTICLCISTFFGCRYDTARAIPKNDIKKPAELQGPGGGGPQGAKSAKSIDA